VSDSATSFRLSDEILRSAELLVKRHPHTLTRPKIFIEGLKVVIQKLNEKGESFPEEPFDELISYHGREIEAIEKEIEFLKNLKEKQKYRKKSPISNNNESITNTGYHQEIRNGQSFMVENDYGD